jgi:DNA-directed RNA polymerase specialized sigma24 family protein
VGDDAAARRAIDAVWRIESPRLIAGLARMVRDVGLAEDLAQDALVAALETWPRSGVPDNPGAWLMATAKHRAIDGFRRAARLERKQEELAFERGLERPTRSPGRSWSARRRSRSRSCGRSGRWPRRLSGSRSRASTSWLRAWPRCSRWCT